MNSLPQKQIKVSHGKQGALITNINTVLLYHVKIYRKKVNALCFKCLPESLILHNPKEDELASTETNKGVPGCYVLS